MFSMITTQYTNSLVKTMLSLTLLFTFAFFCSAQATSSYIAMPSSVKINDVGSTVKVQVIFKNAKIEHFNFGRSGEKGVLEWATTEDEKTFSDVTQDTKPYFFENGTISTTTNTYIVLRGTKLGKMKIGYSDTRYPNYVSYMTVTVMQSDVGFAGVLVDENKKVFKDTAAFTKPKSVYVNGNFTANTDTFVLKISADKIFTCQVQADGKDPLQMKDKYNKLLHQWLIPAPVDSLQITTHTSAAFTHTKNIKLSLSLDKKSATYPFTNMKNKSFTLTYTGATVPAQNNWISVVGKQTDSNVSYYTNGAFFTDTPVALKYYEFESPDSARVVDKKVKIQGNDSVYGTHLFNVTVDTDGVKIWVPTYFYITKPDSYFARGELFKRGTAASKLKALYFLPHSKISRGKPLKERKLAIKDAKKKRGTTFHVDSEISFNGSIVLYHKKNLSTANKKATYAELLKSQDALFGQPCGVTLIVDDRKVDTQYMTVAITRPTINRIDTCIVYTGKKTPDETTKTIDAFVVKGLNLGVKPSFGIQYTLNDRHGNPVVKTVRLSIVKPTYIKTLPTGQFLSVTPQMNTVYLKMAKPIPLLAKKICFYVNNQASIHAIEDSQKLVPIKPL